MARSRLCRACGEFHPLEGAWPEACYSHFGVIPEDAPMVRTDAMAPIRSMLDGRMYDSKSRYYGTLKAAGAEIAGNDKAPFDRRPTAESAGFGQGVGRDIKRAIEQLEGRR